MRSQLLLLIAAFSLVTIVTAEAATPAARTVGSPESLSQSAIWTTRNLQSFAPAYGGACGDAGYGMLRFVLLQLGARESDLKIDRRRCYLESPGQSVDATFSVLTPAASLHDDIHDCAYLRYVTEKVLPLFSTREVKLIPREFCDKHDVGLRAQVLKPTQQLAGTP